MDKINKIIKWAMALLLAVIQILEIDDKNSDDAKKTREAYDILAKVGKKNNDKIA